MQFVVSVYLEEVVVEKSQTIEVGIPPRQSKTMRKNFVCFIRRINWHQAYKEVTLSDIVSYSKFIRHTLLTTQGFDLCKSAQICRIFSAGLCKDRCTESWRTIQICKIFTEVCRFSVKISEEICFSAASKEPIYYIFGLLHPSWKYSQMLYAHVKNSG